MLNHYNNNKDKSVFRRYLGGALLRKDNQNSKCLLPSPGIGHWEMSKHPKNKSCIDCKELRGQVLRYYFSRASGSGLALLLFMFFLNF